MKHCTPLTLNVNHLGYVMAMPVFSQWEYVTDADDIIRLLLFADFYQTLTSNVLWARPQIALNILKIQQLARQL